MNYTLYLKNGIKFAANQRSGKILITLNGYIKLSGKPKQTITERTTRAFLAGTVFETPLKTEENGRMRLRNHKLIPLALACEWLAKDNPELAKAVDGDLMGWLSQFHKPKAASPIIQIPIMEPEIVPATEPVATEAGDLTVLDFGGKNIRFERRGDRVWANLTDMAKATAKLVGNWMRLDGTAEYLVKLESIIQIRIIDSKIGGAGIPKNERGTWAIEEVAIKFAMWCNVDFEIWVTQQIRTLMKEGTVAIAKPQPEPTPAPAPQLTSADRVKLGLDLKSVIEFSGLDTSNPRFAQQIQDLFGDVLGLTQSALPAPDAQK